MVELTSEFVGGLHEALATLCSQAIGVGNKTLAGKYVQIVTLLYTAFFIPFMFMWAVYIDAVLRWFGFDEETVQIGQQYCYILIVDLLFDGLGEAVHGLLDVGGLEQFSTLIGATEEISAFVVLLLVAMYGNVSGLVAVGLIQFGLGVVFLVLNISIIYWKGWFKPYRQGMIGTFALRVSASFLAVTSDELHLLGQRIERELTPLICPATDFRTPKQCGWFAEPQCHSRLGCFLQMESGRSLRFWRG